MSSDSDQSLEQLMNELRERVRLRRTQPTPEPTAPPIPSATAPILPLGPSAYDLTELRRNLEANNRWWNAVGVVNPRPPGLRNALLQSVKRALSRLLAWYTRPLHQFNGSVARSLNEVGGALENFRQALESANQQISGLESTQRILFAAVKEQIAALEESAANFRHEMNERVKDVSKEALFLLDSDKGPKAKQGLRFNDPIMTSYDEKGQAFWWGTTERIIEKAWVLRQVGDLPPGSRILDVGCAESTLSIELASSGFEVTGIDVQPFPLEHPHFTFFRGDICQSRMGAESFDFAIALSTLEHIGLGWYGDPKSDSLDRVAVKEIYRLLKRGGRFLLTVPYGKRATTPLHRIHDRQSLQSLLRGFRVTKAEYGIKVDDKTWLSPVARNQAIGRQHDQKTYFPLAVAMIHCVKRAR